MTKLVAVARWASGGWELSRHQDAPVARAVRTSSPADAAGPSTFADLLRRVNRRAYAFLRPVARRILPRGVRARLADLLAAPSLAGSFRRRSAPLATLTPLLPGSAFDGPIVLVNNALAWGGVERQVVYTLIGVSKRSAAPIGLLCMRLGRDSDHDFYRSALNDFGGFVRNVIAARDAENVLDAALDQARRHMIQECIDWLPADTQEDIRRFLADFLILKPAVVHVWQDALSISAGFAARLAGVPRVMVAGRNVAPTNFNYHRAHMSLAYSELAACAELTMLNNSAAGARSYAEWLALPESRFIVLRNGIDTDSIVRPRVAEVAGLRALLGIPASAPVIGSIFRFYDEKRPLLWVDVAAIIAQSRPDAHFIVFGTGPLRDKMVERARESGLGDRLHLPGTIANAALGLGLLDVFLLTSKFEGTPNVVLEASLMGVPVVATDAGGTAETIDEAKTGFVVRSDRAVDLGLQVVGVLDDSGFRDSVMKAGPRFVLQRFGHARMIDETIQLYQVHDRSRLEP